MVLDLTHVIAGPFCTMMLGDHGADVIKVEHPGHGDHIRAWPPQWNGAGCAYLSLNRNKRSVAIDLKHPRGREAVLRIAARADVVVESLRGSSIERLGLGYDDVKAVNPRAVYCSISGYGKTGPLAELGGYDLIAQAYGGMMSVTGEPGGPPVRAGYSVIDYFAGMAAYGAILTALFARERTGTGQYVQTSLLDTVVAQMGYHAVNHLATGKVPGPLGTASPALVPYQLFEAADAKFIVGCNNDDAWRRLCTALLHEEWKTDPRFATNPERLRNKPVVVEMLQDIFRTKDAAVWVAQLNRHHVPSSRIQSVADVVRDEQVVARDLLPHVPHPRISDLRAPASPFTMAERAPLTAPPDLGEHTDSVLHELGYSADEVRALRSEGAFG